MNIFTLKNLKHTLYVGAAAGAIFLGSMLVTNATNRFVDVDVTPTLTKVFGATTSATDTCQEPKETLVILGDTVELSRTFSKPEEVDPINFYFLIRGIQINTSLLEVYRDDAKPDEVFLVFYEKDAEGKDCAMVTSDDGTKGFWLSREHYVAFLAETALDSNGVEVQN